MGFFSKLKDKANKHFKEVKLERAQAREANKIIRKKANVAYLKAKEKEEISFAKDKAKIISKRKLDAFKSGGGGFGGFAGVAAGLSGVGMQSAPTQRAKSSKSYHIVKRKGSKKGKRVYHTPKHSTPKPHSDGGSGMNEFVGLAPKDKKTNALNFRI